MEGKILDELRSALELATEDELRQFTQILFSRRFNPLDYWQTPLPLEIQGRELPQWLDALESRFRYLAADGLTVIRGKAQTFSYRQTLIQVCHYLKIPYSQKMNTTDLEAEVFLFLVNQAWQRLTPSHQKNLASKIRQSFLKFPLPEPLPLQFRENPVNLILKGSGAIAVSSVLKPLLLQRVVQELTLHIAQYHSARSVLMQGGMAAASQLENQLALQAAQRSLVATTARYGAVRTLFAWVGPVLWGWFIADLGWRAIATNYGRIIPVIFTLAQIRLTREEYWQLA